MKIVSPDIIPTSNLTLSDVPESDAEWERIKLFARTFDVHESDWYEKAGADQDLSKLTANAELALLRAHLFLEYRRWNHFGRPIDNTSLVAIQRVVSLIRAKLADY